MHQIEQIRAVRIPERFIIERTSFIKIPLGMLEMMRRRFSLILNDQILSHIIPGKAPGCHTWTKSPYLLRKELRFFEEVCDSSESDPAGDLRNPMSMTWP